MHNKKGQALWVIIKKCILFIFLILSSCVTYHKTEIVSDDKLIDDYGPDVQWLEDNHKVIVETIINYVREKHPATIDSFPRIKLNTIQVNSKRINMKMSIETEFRRIVNDVLIDLLPPTNKPNQWIMNTEISFLSPNYFSKLSPVKKVALGGYAFTCWVTGLLLVCPNQLTSIVELKTKFITNSGQEYEYQTFGGSKQTELGIYTQFEDDDFTLEIKALAAAIANIADILVENVNAPNK